MVKTQDPGVNLRSSYYYGQKRIISKCFANTFQDEIPWTSVAGDFYRSPHPQEENLNIWENIA